MHVHTVYLSITLLFLNNHPIFTMEQASQQQEVRERKHSWSGQSSELSQALDTIDPNYIDLSQGSGNHPLDLPPEVPPKSIMSILEQASQPSMRHVNTVQVGKKNDPAHMKDMVQAMTLPSSFDSLDQMDIIKKKKNETLQESGKEKFLRCISACTGCFKKDSTKSSKQSEHMQQ